MMRFNIQNNNEFKRLKKIELIDLVLDSTLVTHQQIISINELFLTPGFHTLLLTDVTTGRTILDTFLLSLNCYYRIGCLSKNSHLLPQGIEDIYQDLQQHHKDLDNYFLDAFDFDFIWIEETTESVNDPLFINFKQKLSELRLDQEIPIISLLYRCGRQRY